MDDAYLARNWEPVPSVWDSPGRADAITDYYDLSELSECFQLAGLTYKEVRDSAEMEIAWAAAGLELPKIDDEGEEPW